MQEATVDHTYGWQSDRAEESHAYLVPAVRTLLKKYRVGSLLDIGTGNGATLAEWMRDGIRVAAIEPDKQGFLFAKKHERAEVRNLGVGDAVPADWKNNFDAAVSLEVIEHLYDPSQLVTWAGAAIKQEGIVLISTPYHGYLKNLALALAGKWDFHHHPLRNGGHIKFWSRKTMRELFEQHGFREVEFAGAGRLPYLWKSMIMIFKKEQTAS